MEKVGEIDMSGGRKLLQTTAQAFEPKLKDRDHNRFCLFILAWVYVYTCLCVYVCACICVSENVNVCKWVWRQEADTECIRQSLSTLFF